MRYERSETFYDKKQKIQMWLYTVTFQNKSGKEHLIRQNSLFDGIYYGRLFFNYLGDEMNQQEYDAWLEDVTDELDTDWGSENNNTLWGESGFEEEITLNNAHSKRSRNIKRAYKEDY